MPFIGSRHGNQKRGGRDKRKPLDGFDEFNPAFGAFQHLVSKLQSVRGKNGATESPRSVLITSPLRGEGKTGLASRLAVATAKFTPGRTLLLDMDLRNPQIHSVFALDGDKGVTDLLINGVELESCLQQTHVQRLSVMTSGREIPSMSHILDPVKVRALLLSACQMFDKVIIDSPPTLPVPDSCIVATEANATVLVVMAGKTPKGVAAAALRLLQERGANVIGVVVNNKNRVFPSYYYSYRRRQ